MDHDLARSLGASARAARRRRGFTQEDAAEQIGISAAFYARIERGTTLPSVPTLARMATVLDVSADELLGHARALPSRDGEVFTAADAAHPPYVASTAEEAASAASATPPVGLPPAEARVLRRLVRRLRRAGPKALRLLSTLAHELVAAEPATHRRGAAKAAPRRPGKKRAPNARR
jgi:transcriptional regulator with XRE-family HTH domain